MLSPSTPSSSAELFTFVDNINFYSLRYLAGAFPRTPFSEGKKMSTQGVGYFFFPLWTEVCQLLSSRSDVDGYVWSALCARNMFHVFHGLSTLWNIYVEHRFVRRSARCGRSCRSMFHCSSKFRFMFTSNVDRCYLLLLFY
jgi:hypothetical protein